MKIAIVNKETLQVATIYDSTQPNQAAYGGPWGQPSQYAHVALDGIDPRAAVFELVGNNIEVSEDEELAEAAAQADAMAAVTAAIAKATAFGQTMITKFAAQNVLLGITQDGKTGEVLDKMGPVIVALQSGSLYEAIERAKAITPDMYDPKYVTHDRLYSFINELEAYLGLPLSL